MDQERSKQLAVYTLSFCELLERFSYFGLLTILILELHAHFHFSDTASFGLFGLFAALSFGLLVVSGYLSDRFMGFKRAIIIGGILLIAGNVFLASGNLLAFYAGMSLIILGTALFKVNCTSLIGHLYHEEDAKRERSFTLLYSCMNIGGMLSPLIYGVIIKNLGWSWCFLLSAFLIAISLVIFLCNPYLKTLKNITQGFFFYACLLTAIVTIFLFFRYSNFASKSILWAFLIAISLIFSSILKQHPAYKKRLFAVLFISFFSIFFFACSLQVASSVTLFIERDIHKVIFGMNIPTSAFTSLDPLFVVVMAVFFTWLWKHLATRKKEPFITTKISIGISLACLAFICLAISADLSFSKHYVPSLIWLFISYVFLGAGEICITPAILSAISKYSPHTLQSTMVGTWFLFIAFGGYLAGQLSKLSDAAEVSVTRMMSAHIYSHAFLEVACFALLAAVAAFFSKPVIKYLLR